MLEQRSDEIVVRESVSEAHENDRHAGILACVEISQRDIVWFNVRVC